MNEQEVKAFVGKPVRVTTSDGRIFAGTLHQEGPHGHAHNHYVVVSDPIQKGGEKVREVIHGAALITDIEDASDDPAAIE
jgi:hypothetical protein